MSNQNRDHELSSIDLRSEAALAAKELHHQYENMVKEAVAEQEQVNGNQ